MIICSKFKELIQNENHYIIKTNNIDLKVVFVTNDIVRIRAGFSNEFKEASYSLVMTAWEDKMDSLFKDERKRVTSLKAEVLETDENVSLKTESLKLIINKDPLGFSLYDDKDCLYSDIYGNAFVKDTNNRVIHYSEITDNDYFYGFGEKTGTLNKANKQMKMSPKDAMGYNPIETDPLYKHIPFYIKLNDETKKAIGLFYHNTYECEFTMGKEKSNYWKKYSKYSADGGDIDLFLIAGPLASNVIERYTDLTGKSVMLPKYALGYLGSSMYYSELDKDCDDEILKFVDTNKEEQIPIDGFQLSSGYTVQNNKRYVLTWNYDRFKDPEKFFSSMEEKGVTVSPNVKPGILLTHPNFNEFLEQNLFVKSSDESSYCVGKWWGGDGAFIDFTSEQNRQTWAKLITKNVLEKGTTSIWNDNCEYDGIIDKDAICCFEGEKGTIGQLKSIMSNLMCYTTIKAINEFNKNERPFIVCRSGFSGIQRYAQTWAGDNFTSWDSLKYNIATILGMGISGVANQGCDIGGFYGPAPEAELLVRWVQNGIFQPRFSIHSTNTDNTVTEPWMYSDYKKYIQKAIQFRYKMFPYLYSLMNEAHEKGTPIMRAMFLEYQDDINCYNEGVDFMFGKSLLVANIFEKNATVRDIYLPNGDDFYDFNTRQYYRGGQKITIPVDIDSIPMFIRSGAIIPISLNNISNLHKEDVKELKIIIEPSKDSTFALYEDDGISFDYKQGIYLKTQINVESGEKVTIDFNKTGSYKSSVESILLDVIKKDKSPYWVSIDNEKLTHYLHRDKFEKCEQGWYYSQSLKSVQIKYKNITKSYKVIISFEAFDLLGM